MESGLKNKFSFDAFRDITRNSLRLSRIVYAEYKGIIIVLGSIMLVAAVMPFAQSGTRGLLINELVRAAGGGVFSSLLLLSIAALVAAALLPTFVSLLEIYFNKKLWFFLNEKLQLSVMEKKANLDVARHEDPHYNDLFNKISENGIWRAQNFVDRQFYISQNFIEVIIASAVLLYSQKWAFAALLIGTIPELITEILYGHEVWGIEGSRAEVKRRYWDLQGYFSRLGSLIELRLFQNIGYFLGMIKDLFRRFQIEEKQNERRKLINQLLARALSQVVVSASIVYFVYEVVRGNFQIGTFTFLLASISDFRQSLSGLFMNLGRQYQDSLFVTDLFKFLDIEPVLPRPPEGIILDPSKTPEIIFDHVTFSYPGTTKPVFKDFNLKISSGEKIAFVGINGAGKTTLVKLLCRFYDPDEGMITVSGHDLRTIDLESWYYMLGILFQDYSKYHFLVRDAIALGRTGTKSSIEKVKDAAKSSEADIFIEEWENKYEQMIGKEFTGGIEPSIGQWQKLALARTFYRDPRVLILDEPTSSIDAEAEAKIFDKLESLPDDRTTILISHRFSTVRKADKIVVIEDGKIKEMGSHHELLKLNGTYARLFKLQAAGYK